MNEVASKGPRKPGVAACAGGIAVLAVVISAVDRWGFLDVPASWQGKAAAVVAAAILATALWGGRQSLFRVFTSLPFAVGIVAMILLATALGTFVIQGAVPEEYAEKYGALLGPTLLRLGLNDIFHSAWFSVWLGLLALSLVLVAIRERAWRPLRWGHGLSHFGVVVVLIGGFIGSRWGMRGNLDLHEGHAVEAFAYSGGTAPFGFSLKLEDFEIEQYDPEYRVYVYEESGGSYLVLQSFKPEAAAEWKPAGSSEAKFRVVREYPDYHLRAELAEVPAGQGVPALRVDFGSKEMHLLAGVQGRDAVNLAPMDGPLLRFVWEVPGETEVNRWTESRPERHMLSMGTGETAEEHELARDGAVQVGGGAWSVRIVKYYPDFVFDSEKREATSRSDRPDNPAIQVVVTPAAGGAEETRWLFAKMPEFDHGRSHGGPRMTYRFDPGSRPAAKELLVVGKASEMWEIAKGKVLRKSPLAPEGGTLPGLDEFRVRVLPSARESFVSESRSKEWRNPAVEIEVAQGGKTHVEILKALHGVPLRLPDDKTLLAFEAKQDDVKAYRSRLSVLEGGRKVVGKTIAVNDPLSYGGFTFYQSNYRKDDPTYSGILVVKDPGLPLVWMGLVMMSLGVIFVYYVRPRLEKRKAAV